MYQVESPILFIIFNRPEETSTVFEAIKQAKPSKLYIAADGPRINREDDILLCEQTLNMVKSIDWVCDVKTLFREKNMGCKLAVSSAINWFFENEPEGIILEDDCLPTNQFFEFCDVLLDKYRDDKRIRHISGSNLNVGRKINSQTYYFSKLTNVWGWASWRRVWNDYDVNLKLFDNIDKPSYFNNIFFSNTISKYLFQQFWQTKQGNIDTWDYQYLFCNLINNGLSINPNYNMISNIGFSKSATHTADSNNVFANMPTEDFGVISHPEMVVPDTLIDVLQLKKQLPSLYVRTKQKIKTLFKL